MDVISNTLRTQISSFTFHISVLVFCDTGFKLLLIVYEYCKYKQRYPPHRLLNVVKYGLVKGSSIALILLVCCASHFAMETSTNKELIWEELKLLFLPFMVYRAFNLKSTYIELAHWIRSSSGLDYATGMASNYFHGYLRLQLPQTGHSTKGLKERLMDYEDSQGVTVPVKRLFILIPRSLHTKPKIESRVMTNERPVESVKIHRAGVENRDFGLGSIYRIQNDTPWYVALEGATPLLSFYESMQHRITSTPEMVDLQHEITLQFYKSLKKMIQDCPDTRGLVELVYYNDIDSNNQNVDVGIIVRERIRRIISESYND